MAQGNNQTVVRSNVFWLAGWGFAFLPAYSQLDILRPNHWGVAIIIGPLLLLLVLGTFIGQSAK